MRRLNDCLTSEQISQDIYVESPLVHPSVTFCKNIVQELGGYRDGPFPEDYDLWLRLHHAGHRMDKLPQTLLYWRAHPGSLSRTCSRYSREAFDKLRALYMASDPLLLKNRDHFVIWGAGRMTRRRTTHLQQQGFTPCAWIDIDPKKIGSIPVHPPKWLETNKPFVLVYVANHGAQELISNDLIRMGYQKGTDFFLVG